MTNVLVIGTSGFVGSEVVRQARSFGMRVCAAGRRNASPFPDLDYLWADILDPDNLKPVMEGVACVIHSAGLAHVFGKRQAVTAPFHLVNETGTANVARAAVEAGVRHLILVSSVSVYGPHSAEARDENAPCQPEGAYAISKWQAEQRAAEIVSGAETALTILRMATIYGEGDPGNVARLMRSINRGRFIWVGSGANRKSLIHREDAARACVVAANAPASGIRIYNVSAPACTMRDVVENLAQALNRPVPPWRIPASVAIGLAYLAARLSGGHLGSLYTTVQKWLADDVYDARKFEVTFGFRARVSLTEGLRREVEWYRGQETCKR